MKDIERFKISRFTDREGVFRQLEFKINEIIDELNKTPKLTGMPKVEGALPFVVKENETADKGTW